jgi:hypothetical protein
MKQKDVVIVGLMSVVFAALAVIPAAAQTVANGPYYATPSWDQTLPSSTRFIVLSNMGSNAVLDRETGLVWEKSPNIIPKTWLEAQNHCNTLSLGNRKGWRLPTLQELASLIDPSVPSPGPTLPAGHPYTNVQSSIFGYWSATTDVTFSGFAWVVSFRNSDVAHNTKSSLNSFVWCVRGGQGVDAQ